jgi:surface antigen/LysM repeat protein
MTFRPWKSSALAAYVGAFLFIITIVAIGYQPPEQNSTTNVANAVTSESLTAPGGQAFTPSVDQLVATRVAAGIAERAELPIARNIAQISTSLAVESELAQADNNVIVKPQIIQLTTGGRDIRSYTTIAGDNVAKLSAQFGVSADTIKWANNLTSDLLEPGKELQIPPANGIIYTIKDGDTTASIAEHYKADERQITAYNDLESGLTVGKKILVLDGDLPAAERPGYVAPRPIITLPNDYGGYVVGGYGGGGSVGNRYAFGNCTYYVYDRRAAIGRPVGSFWGNAATWASAARASGYRVDNVPEPGAVAQWNAYAGAWIGYAGHVGIVETVNDDGTVTISEMNNGAYGGFNVVNRRTIPASAVSNYIH